VLGGHTPIGFTVLTPAVPQVKEGLLRALAVTTPKRSAALPDVPTLTEAGLSEQEADTILGVLAPAGTPEHIIALLYREIGSGMGQADAAEKLAALGFDPVLSTPDDFAARIRIDIPKWAEVIRVARIRPD
jgi:tripartite-type tricarboxylate transporter receptor subunit TctC